jgi:predicted phage terminase large subunit-like protein
LANFLSFYAGIKEKQAYLLHVLRKRLNYPELKRDVREQAEAFGPKMILIEDRASGTQLIRELIKEGVHAVKAYKTSMDKIMRMRSVTSTIENGFVYLLKGRLYVATASGVQVIDSNGQYLGTIRTPATIRNLAFGGTQRSTLVTGEFTNRDISRQLNLSEHTFVIIRLRGCSHLLGIRVMLASHPQG